MSRYIKIICVLVCLLILAGCVHDEKTSAPQTDAISVPEIIPVQPKDVAQAAKPVASLYFYSPTKKALVVSTRTLTASTEHNQAYEILNELAAGPADINVEPVLPDGTAVESLEISQGVATVSFSNAFNALSEYGKFVARAAITDTLLEVDGIQVVNILVGGRAMQFNQAPVGALLRQHPRDLDLLYQRAISQGNQRDDYAQMLQQQPEEQAMQQDTQNQTTTEQQSDDQHLAQAETVTRRMVLYFPDNIYGLMLAEHREVTFQTDKAVEAVLAELMDGPKTSASLRTPIPIEAILFRPPTQSQNDGRYTLNLDFTAQFSGTMAKLEPEEVKEAVASLVLSITSFIPQVDAVRLLVEGQAYTPVSLASVGGNAAQDGYSRDDFAYMVGNTIGLYFPTENQDAMHRIMRPVMQDTWHLAATRLSELAKGEVVQATDANNWAWPQPLDQADHPVVTSQVGNTVFVDVTPNFINLISTLSAQQERMIIYCIVNTLVDTQGISCVRFQSEGQPIQDWPGLLSINSAFVRNPGLIQD